jgi:uncharacterized protein YqeY
MSLRERIDAEIKAAMKSKDKVRLETVRGIKKFILEKEVSLRPSGQDTLTVFATPDVRRRGESSR